MRLAPSSDEEDANALTLCFAVKTQCAWDRRVLSCIFLGVERFGVVAVIGICHLLVIGQSGFVDVEHQCKFLLMASPGNAARKKIDCELCLVVKILGVTSARTGTCIIALELEL